VGGGGWGGGWEGSGKREGGVVKRGREGRKSEWHAVLSRVIWKESERTHARERTKSRRFTKKESKAKREPKRTSHE